MNRIKSTMAMVLSVALIASVMSGLTLGTDAIAASYGISNPTVDKNYVVTWDSIYFGNYWQEDTNGDQKVDGGDAKQPIKWRVLSVNGDDAFIMAENCLDYQKYNEEDAEVTWQNCTLRKWLNGTFYVNAFSLTEQDAIQTTTVIHDNDPYNGTDGGKDTQDKIYLPSLKEVTTLEYGFDVIEIGESNTRHSYATSYAVKYVTDSDLNLNAPFSWWTRTPGSDLHYVRGIQGGSVKNGMNQNGYLCYTERGVRPALHIDLSSSEWKKADAVQQKSNRLPDEKTSTEKKQDTTKKPSTATKAKAPKVSYKLKANKLTVKYTASKNTAGFQVRYKLGKGKWKVKTYNTKKSVSKTIRGLKKGKYTVQVRSFQKGRKNYSKWSKAKIIKVKKTKK